MTEKSSVVRLYQSAAYVAGLPLGTKLFYCFLTPCGKNQKQTKKAKQNSQTNKQKTACCAGDLKTMDVRGCSLNFILGEHLTSSDTEEEEQDFSPAVPSPA